LLYLPTQIRFLIGGECVTCHGSKLTNSLGWTKLTNSLGKQQLELSTCSWSGCALCNTNSGKFVCQLAWCQKAIEVRQRFSLEKAFIIQEKGFIIAKTYQINKGETFSVFKLLIWCQKCVAFGTWRLALRSPSSGRKIVVSFTTKYAAIRRSQSNLSIVFLFFSCEEKDYYHVVLAWQLSLTAAHTAGTATLGVKRIIFFYFWVGRYNKTLNDWPLGKRWVLFPLTLSVPLGFASGNIKGLGEAKLAVSLGASR